ncbi:Hemin uptake protein HemP [Albimonas pacifica]|uniref:Hemin uptake protein HemP n=1 Tax=Albimonas pacifica TaxID=1114924 RepID=A0A1I3C320_9RHOB|nr:Hemin uptake protein HemP [Albimonas pacifica]
MSYLRPISEPGSPAAEAQTAEARALVPGAERARREAELKSPPMHDARALTGGGSEARIVLDGSVYTLRVTRLKKLILTK